MTLLTHIPQPPLNQFIDYFIYAADYNPEHSIDRFLPDGNTEIIIDFGDAPQYIYDNHTLKEIQACQNVWASGVRTEFISIPSGKLTTKLIISFKKGMAAPVLSAAHERSFRSSPSDADLLWGDDFSFLRELLFEIQEIDLKFVAVEDFLLSRFRSRLILNPAVNYALAEIIRQPDQISLARISQRIGYSQKHFISMFKRQVGVTPKAYLKIIRFQKAITEIEKSGEVDWAKISQDCGFYDQAHFINDFKSFSGFTPERYLKHRNGVLNYVPVG